MASARGPAAVKEEQLSEAYEQDLQALLRTYTEPLMCEKTLPGASGARLRRAACPSRIEHYPQLKTALEELHRDGRRATLLRLLRALLHYESVGVTRGELPPAADYFGRKFSAAERRAREVVRETPVIVIDDDEPGEARSGRTFAPIDVEEYMLKHRDSLWEQEATAPANGLKVDPNLMHEALPAVGANVMSCVTCGAQVMSVNVNAVTTFRCCLSFC